MPKSTASSAPAAPASPLEAIQAQYLALVEDVGEEQMSTATIVLFLSLLLAIRMYGAYSGQKRMKGDKVLSMKGLNSAVLFKEVFLAYLNAALLEPVLAIAGMESATGPQVQYYALRNTGPGAWGLGGLGGCLRAVLAASSHPCPLTHHTHCCSCLVWLLN